MKVLQKLKSKAKELKSEMNVLVIAYRDSRTPSIAKIIIAITVGYLLSPIDLIPDFIPVLGLLDDIIIVPLLIKLSIKLIPQIVLIEARQKVIQNAAVLKKNSWLVATIIVATWILLIFFVYKIFRHFWQ